MNEHGSKYAYNEEIKKTTSLRSKFWY